MAVDRSGVAPQVRDGETGSSYRCGLLISFCQKFFFFFLLVCRGVGVGLGIVDNVVVSYRWPEVKGPV